MLTPPFRLGGCAGRPLRRDTPRSSPGASPRSCGRCPGTSGSLGCPPGGIPRGSVGETSRRVQPGRSRLLGCLFIFIFVLLIFFYFIYLFFFFLGGGGATPPPPQKVVAFPFFNLESQTRKGYPEKMADTSEAVIKGSNHLEVKGSRRPWRIWVGVLCTLL